MLIAKYGSVTRGWRIGLDKDQNGILDFREMVDGMHRLGFIGNIKTLWFNLHADSSGNVSLKELDPVAAARLEKFRALSTTGYGSIDKMWSKVLDQDHSGTVSIAEFVNSVAVMGCNDDEAGELFKLLALQPGGRVITLDDIMFLQKWEDRKQEKADRKRPASWVNKDPYLRVGTTMSSVSSAFSATTLPEEALDHSTIVALDAGRRKDSFRQFLTERYGSLCKAFDIMDFNGSGGLSMLEFQYVAVTVLRYCRPTEARRLFLAFNGDPLADVTWENLGISREAWQAYSIEKARTDLIRARAKASPPGPLGSSPRMQVALQRHKERVVAKPRGAVAFNMPLPPGWGFPPDFKPPDPWPLSAR